MIHAVLLHEQPQTACEIGCAMGFSTSAFWEALEVMPGINRVDLIDPFLTQSVVKHSTDQRIKFHRIPSQSFKGTPEMWMIDGDHGFGAKLDYDNAIRAKAKIIIIHDSNPESSAGRQNWGAVGISEKLKLDSTIWFEDKLKRDNEMTDRGLVIGFFYEPSADTIESLQKLAI